MDILKKCNHIHSNVTNVAISDEREEKDMMTERGPGGKGREWITGEVMSDR